MMCAHIIASCTKMPKKDATRFIYKQSAHADHAAEIAGTLKLVAASKANPRASLSVGEDCSHCTASGDLHSKHDGK